MPSMIRSSAPGMVAAVSLPPSTGTSGSSAPCSTTVGAVMVLSAFAAVARGDHGDHLAQHAHRVVGALDAGPQQRPLGLGVHRPGRALDGDLGLQRMLDQALQVGGGRTGEQHRLGLGLAGGTAGLPVVDITETSDSTLAGWRAASIWPIIPPIDTPATWARAMPRASSRPAASSAMSASR
jgi:hypothetical protein